MAIKSKKLSALKIAEWFINRVDRSSGDDITQLKLQKLIYYAQAWWLANNNESLFKEDMEAWAHGPVAPSVWQEYKDNGWQSLPPIENFKLGTQYKAIEGFLDSVYESYGKYSAKELEKLTHNEEPWISTRRKLSPEARCEDAIKKEVIRDYYAKRINKK